MHELAAQAVGAVEGRVVLFAEARFVLGGHVPLFLDLVVSVGEGARITETALSC